MPRLRLRLFPFERGAFKVYLEPEGAEHFIPRGTVTVQFPEGTEEIDVAWDKDGLSVWRDFAVDEMPEVRDESGAVLDW